MRKHVLSLMAVSSLALFAFACGSDDDGDSSGSTTAQPTSTVADADGDQSGAGDTGSQSDSEAGADTAVVTIGDETYEFNLLGCVALGGAIGGVGQAADGRDISIDITLPPEDWETSNDDWDPPYVRLDNSETDQDWRAGGDIVAESASIAEGQSQVDSFSIDGSSASGTATFVDFFVVLRGENVEPLTGTFAINCGS